MAAINFLKWWDKNKNRIYKHALSTCWGSLYSFTQEAWENGYLTAMRAKPKLFAPVYHCVVCDDLIDELPCPNCGSIEAKMTS